MSITKCLTSTRSAIVSPTAKLLLTTNVIQIKEIQKMEPNSEVIRSIPKEVWGASINLINKLVYPVTATTVGRFYEQKPPSQIITNALLRKKLQEV